MVVSGKKIFVSGNVREVPYGNGNVGFYRDYDGLFLNVARYEGKEDVTRIFPQADGKMADILKDAMRSGRRLRFWYGDIDTGKAWNEEYDVTGRVGRSCGKVKVPLLLRNSRSCGGGELSVSSIVRIDDIEERRTLYKHANFHTSDYRIVENPKGGYDVMDADDGSVYRCGVTLRQARRYTEFMTGARYAK
jgi:hypothetical protein